LRRNKISVETNLNGRVYAQTLYLYVQQKQTTEIKLRYHLYSM